MISKVIILVLTFGASPLAGLTLQDSQRSRATSKLGQTHLVSPQHEHNDAFYLFDALEDERSPTEWLEALDPQLADCDWEAVHSVRDRSGTRHIRLRLMNSGYEIYGSELALHHRDGKTVLVTATLPQVSCTTDFDEVDWPAEDIPFRGSPVLFPVEDRLIPAWSIALEQEERVVSVDMGEILHIEPKEFHGAVGQVFEKNSLDTTSIQPLVDLDDSGYLNGKFFEVFAPDEANERVFRPDRSFIFDPEDEQEALSFDQVQAYYAATKATDWLRQRGFDLAERLKVRVGAVVDRTVNNAKYLPAQGQRLAEVQIGAGDGINLTNLARDTDVMFHEFSHHVIYRYLKTSRGETGILHEGTADFLAYAMNGDPYLGETIWPGQPFLRTADLPDHVRYDDPRLGFEPHRLGEVWSAFLWELYLEIGPEFESWVLDSLTYLPTKGGIQLALTALLNVDRDRYPLNVNDSEEGIFGQHKCVILKRAVARGFATYLTDVNGQSCGLDLPELASASRTYSKDLEAASQKEAPDEHPPEVMGIPCGVVQGQTLGGSFLMLLILLAPLLLAGWKRQKEEI